MCRSIAPWFAPLVTNSLQLGLSLRVGLLRVGLPGLALASGLGAAPGLVPQSLALVTWSQPAATVGLPAAAKTLNQAAREAERLLQRQQRVQRSQQRVTAQQIATEQRPAVAEPCYA